jgi:hypothetical protein
MATRGSVLITSADGTEVVRLHADSNGDAAEAFRQAVLMPILEARTAPSYRWQLPLRAVRGRLEVPGDTDAAKAELGDFALSEEPVFEMWVARFAALVISTRENAFLPTPEGAESDPPDVTVTVDDEGGVAVAFAAWIDGDTKGDVVASLRRDLTALDAAFAASGQDGWCFDPDGGVSYNYGAVLFTLLLGELHGPRQGRRGPATHGAGIRGRRAAGDEPVAGALTSGQ